MRSRNITKIRASASSLKEIRIIENQIYAALDRVAVNIKEKRQEPKKPGDFYRAYFTAEIKDEWKE